MPTSIITTEDLQLFKQELLAEIKELLLKQKSGSPNRYLQSKDVMKMLQISPGTLQNFRVNGTLPYTKIGGKLYYDIEDINILLTSNRVNNNF